MLKMSRLRKDMEFNSLMGGVLEALKGVASAEYFRLQSERNFFTEFEDNLKSFFENFKLGEFRHPFLDIRQGPKNIILITSDASFLGKLNMSVVNSAFEQYLPGDLLTVVGRQGVRYVEELGKEFTFFSGIGDDISYQSIVELRDYIIKTFIAGKLSETIIIYPHFVSFSVQTIQQLRFLPCRFLFPHETASDAEESEEVLIEPSKKMVVEYLVKVWLTRSIHQIFWESKLSEWAARVIHLDKSVDETKKQEKSLRLNYFRLLHQISDQNIREIFCNRMVLAKETRREIVEAVER